MVTEPSLLRVLIHAAKRHKGLLCQTVPQFPFCRWFLSNTGLQDTMLMSKGFWSSLGGRL